MNTSSESKEIRPQSFFRSLRPWREEWIFLASGVLTALTTVYLYLVKYKLFARLHSNHNYRLLNSAQAWIDHGYWNLSGLLYFQEKYSGSFPDTLYRSHSPFYVLPHYFALLRGGESSFWFVVNLITVLTAFFMSMGLAYLAWASLSSLSRLGGWAAVRGAPFVAAVAAFSVSFGSESIWSLEWNSFDGSAATLFFVFAIVVAVATRSTGFQRWEWLSLALLVVSALVSSRFGLVLTASLLWIRFTELWRSREYSSIRKQSVFSNRAIVLVLLASLSHFLHLFVATFWQGLRLRGSDLLPRMGLSAWWQNAGQGPLHYQTPLDAFTFIWRQSEVIIYKLPAWISIHHFIIWVIALVSAALLVGEKRYFDIRPYLQLLFLPALIWTVALNQSAAEHPDLVAILWVPAYVLGIAVLFGRLFVLLRQRVRRSQVYLYLSLMIWLFFLWQNQYFMRAYLP